MAKQCGVEFTVPESISENHVPTGDTVVLVADYVVHPRWADQLLRENVPHMSVIFSDQTITVGPLVTPGETPCLVCMELFRRDDTAEWLEVSSQLWGKQSPLHTPHNLGMAWAVLLMLLSPGGAQGGSPGFTRAAFAVGEGKVLWQSVEFHPRCGCRGVDLAS